jgi:hypothetical protein
MPLRHYYAIIALTPPHYAAISMAAFPFFQPCRRHSITID